MFLINIFFLFFFNFTIFLNFILLLTAWINICFFVHFGEVASVVNGFNSGACRLFCLCLWWPWRPHWISSLCFLGTNSVLNNISLGSQILKFFGGKFCWLNFRQKCLNNVISSYLVVGFSDEREQFPTSGSHLVKFTWDNAQVIWG